MHGDGPQTLVMVRGLGSNSCVHGTRRPRFSRNIFAPWSSTIAERAAPTSLTRAVLDAADGSGRGRADGRARTDRAVAGNLDGRDVIAQEFALNYPERLTALILGCTNFGGPTVVQAEPEII